jgi:hypothetical protein
MQPVPVEPNGIPDDALNEEDIADALGCDAADTLDEPAEAVIQTWTAPKSRYPVRGLPLMPSGETCNAPMSRQPVPMEPNGFTIDDELVDKDDESCELAADAPPDEDTRETDDDDRRDWLDELLTPLDWLDELLTPQTWTAPKSINPVRGLPLVPAGETCRAPISRHPESINLPLDDEELDIHLCRECSRST